jgi:hypothetical protein
MDAYKILNIARDASDDEVKRAYRAMAKKYHPDAGGDAWVFQQVQAAYDSIRSGKAVPPTRPNRAKSNRSQSNPAKRQCTTPKQPQPTAARDKTKNAAEQVATTWLQSMRRIFGSELPLQSETSVFILVSVLDIFMTYALLRFGGREANPIAKYFLSLGGIPGMVFWKMITVAFVTSIAQLVATRNLERARLLLMISTTIVGCVVIYGLTMFVRYVR